MDTKRLITYMLVVMALIFGWQAFVAWQYQKNPQWRRQGQTAPEVALPENVESTQPTIAQQPEAPATPPSIEAAPSSAAPSITPPASIGGFRIVSPAENARSVMLGSTVRKDAEFPLAVSISPRGAGLESVALNDFNQDVDGRQLYTFQQPYEGGADADNTRSLATRAIIINGSTYSLLGAVWQLEGEATDTTATYYLDIVEPSGAALRLRQTFEIFPRTHAGKGFEIAMHHGITTESAHPLAVSLVLNGPTTPPSEVDRGPDRQFIVAYQVGSSVELEHQLVENFTAKKPSRDLTLNEDGEPAVWLSASSVYFNAIVLPLASMDDRAQSTGFEKIEAHALNPQADAHHRHVAATFQTKEFPVTAGQEKIVPMRVYFGPKDRGVLKAKDAYYTDSPRFFDLTLIITGACAFCTFQWLVNGLVWMLRFFHMIFHDWGLAIIALVGVVRLLLHPVTKRATVNMHKMSKLQPEIERLRKKHGDNKDELNRAMMQFYKEHGGSQVLGCLPMFLQMPIWIALWQSLQTTFELRHAPFFYGFTWINDLAKPDHLITWNPIPLLFGIEIGALNVLPLLLAVVFFLQQKFQPQPPSMTKEQEQQRKMMQWMSLLFPVFLYNGPSGLNLYILTSTTIGIIEAKRIRDHIKEREAKEAEERVLVDPGKATRAGKRRDREEPAPPKKKGGIAGWLADLQARAEAMKNEQQGRKKP